MAYKTNAKIKYDVADGRSDTDASRQPDTLIYGPR